MKGTEEETEEHFQQRNDARQGKIIGRPAHLTGPRKSPPQMTYLSHGQNDGEQQTQPQSQTGSNPAKSEEQEPAKQPQSQASPVEQRENNQ